MKIPANACSMQKITKADETRQKLANAIDKQSEIIGFGRKEVQSTKIFSIMFMKFKAPNYILTKYYIMVIFI